LRLSLSLKEIKIEARCSELPPAIDERNNSAAFTSAKENRWQARKTQVEIFELKLSIRPVFSRPIVVSTI